MHIHCQMFGEASVCVRERAHMHAVQLMKHEA